MRITVRVVNADPQYPTEGDVREMPSIRMNVAQVIIAIRHLVTRVNLRKARVNIVPTAIRVILGIVITALVHVDQAL